MKNRTRSGRGARYVIAVVALGVLVAACGDDDDSTASEETTTTTAPVEDVCADRDGLQSSVDGLKDVDVAAEGTNGVKAAADDVATSLAALKASAGPELQADVTAVEDALDDLDSAAADIEADGAAPALSAVASVATSAATLLESLDQCS